MVAVDGEVVIVRQGEELSARLMAQVFEGDVIRTGADGRVKLFFESSEVMTTIAENSEVTIAEYHFREENMLWKVLFSLVAGRMRLDIEKVFGKDISVMTPNAIAGAKGTAFVVEYDAEKELSLLLVISGKVLFEGKAGSVFVGPGQWSKIRAALPPRPPEPAPPELKDKMVFRMRTQGVKSPAKLLLSLKSLIRAGLEGRRMEVRAVSQKMEQVSTNPQDSVMSKSGAVVVPGPLSVAPSEALPESPKPMPHEPAPPKPPAPEPRPGGGAGGPF